jgi:hypothetical protein
MWSWGIIKRVAKGEPVSKIAEFTRLYEEWEKNPEGNAPGQNPFDLLSDEENQKLRELFNDKVEGQKRKLEGEEEDEVNEVEPDIDLDNDLDDLDDSPTIPVEKSKEVRPKQPEVPVPAGASKAKPDKKFLDSLYMSMVKAYKRDYEALIKKYNDYCDTHECDVLPVEDDIKTLIKVWEM